MPRSLTREEQQVLEEARRVMASAYAPYSRFRVGAALETEDGRTFTGCNVENASHPVSICAERVALGSAVAEGATRFRRLAIFTEARRPTPPCGMCRQALAEFGVGVEVHSATAGGERRSWRLSDLLPDAFGPDQVRSGAEGGA